MKRPRLLVVIPIVFCSQICVAQENFKGKLKSVTQVTYFCPDKNKALDKNNVTLTRTRKWDRNGHLLSDKEVHRKVAGITDTSWTGEEISKYNKSGQLTDRTAYNYLVRHMHSTRTYNDKGQLAVMSGWAAYYSDDDTVQLREEYAYSDAGKKQRVRSYYINNQYPSSIEYYNASEKLDSIISIGNNDSVVGRTLVKYDDSGNEIERVFVDEKGGDRRWEYKYNDKGQKVEENSWRRVTYKYDDKGNEVESMQYDKSGRLQETITKTYDDNGCLVKVLTDNRDLSPERTYYKEEDYAGFDKAGNPLKKTEIMGKKRKEQTIVTVNKIKYYKK